MDETAAEILQLSDELWDAVQAGQPPETLPFELVHEFCSVSAQVWSMRLDEMDRVQPELLDFIRRYADAQRTRQRQRALEHMRFRARHRSAERENGTPAGGVLEHTVIGLLSAVEDRDMAVRRRARAAALVAHLLEDGLFQPPVRALFLELRRAACQGDAAAGLDLAALTAAAQGPLSGPGPRRAEEIFALLERTLEVLELQNITWRQVMQSLCQPGADLGPLEALIPTAPEGLRQALQEAARGGPYRSRARLSAEAAARLTGESATALLRRRRRRA